MRLGLSLNEAYLLVLAGLVLLAIIGTGYGQWAIRRAVSPEQIARIRVVNSRVRMGWWLILIFTIAFSLGHNYLLAVFGIISFFLFREFVALTPTRPSDHWALVASFYIVIPVQYVLIGLGQYTFFTLFIPVYFFMLLPVLMMIRQDHNLFLERVAKIQWGLMLSVYCLSHAPALVNLSFDRYGSNASFLLLFLLLVVFLGDLFAVMASSYFGGKALRDNPNKTIKGVALGGRRTIKIGYAMFWMTPFRSEQALLMALAITLSGIVGDVIIAAVKRSLGSRFMDGDQYITRGTLERLAPLMFAAPVFYHITESHWALSWAL